MSHEEILYQSKTKTLGSKLLSLHLHGWCQSLQISNSFSIRDCNRILPFGWIHFLSATFLGLYPLALASLHLGVSKATSTSCSDGQGPHMIFWPFPKDLGHFSSSAFCSPQGSGYLHFTADDMLGGHHNKHSLSDQQLKPCHFLDTSLGKVFPISHGSEYLTPWHTSIHVKSIHSLRNTSI